MRFEESHSGNTELGIRSEGVLTAMNGTPLIKLLVHHPGDSRSDNRRDVKDNVAVDHLVKEEAAVQMKRTLAVRYYPSYGVSVRQAEDENLICTMS